MSKTISLLFGVHAHQPVGNFDWVLDDAHVRCYRPFLQTVYRYPDFRFAAHFSGWLLDYMLAKYPEDMRLLQEMVQRGQAELFGAGDTEPVLAVIPYRDRIGQINALSHKLERKLGQRPVGAWLTERVWEATVVPALADCGIQYVTVDDYHFLCAGKHGSELKGFYTTEEDGRKLDLFPISEALRYRLPFSPAAEAVHYIEEMAEAGQDAAAVYFDDIEKFGIWPETYEWVYEKGWLRDFIEGVLASPVIRTDSYRDYHARGTTRGVVYLPTTSYIEMNEWTLPADAANAYADLVGEAKAANHFESHKAFLRGGIWKNFFSRYPESNWMHKRMLSLSQRYADLPEKKRSARMSTLLYEAQANDAYWHGLFGGLYLPHLRRAVYNAIVELEAMLDQVAPRPALVRYDADLDGCEEIFLQNGTLQAVVKLDGSASLCELDAYRLRHNFGDSLCRQPEHYYRKIHLGAQQDHHGEGIASAHDRVAFKHEIRPQDLQADAAGRHVFREQWQAEPNGVAAPLEYVHEADADNDSSVRFVGKVGHVEVTKRLTLSGNRLTVTFHVDGAPGGLLSTQLNLAMPSCDGPAGRYVYQGGIPGGFGQPLALEGLRDITLDDDVLGGRITLRSSLPANFSAAPHFSVSQSEAGFEKIMQAVNIELVWPLNKCCMEVTVELEVSPH